MNNIQVRTSKKWLIGCGVTLALIIIIGAVIAILLFSKIKSFRQAIMESPTLYTTLLKKDNYQPPANMIISEDDLRQYLAVSGIIRQRLSDWSQKEKIPFNWNDNQIKLNLIAKMYEIREIQAEVLQERRFSLKKFKWITRQLVIIYGGDRVKEMNLYLQAVASEQPQIDSVKELQKIPQENLDLIDRHQQAVDEAMKLWVLGL